MTQLTTSEQLKIYAKYIGSPILIIEEGIEPIYHHMLEGIDFVNQNLIAERVNYKVENIKLLLNDIRDVTDDKVLELCKACYPLGFNTKHNNWLLERSNFTIKISSPTNEFRFELDIEYGNLYLFQDNIQVDFIDYVDVINFWYENNFMLRYKGKTLFELGIAVDIKEL